jgi:uncharacterized protein YciI
VTVVVFITGGNSLTYNAFGSINRFGRALPFPSHKAPHAQVGPSAVLLVQPHKPTQLRGAAPVPHANTPERKNPCIGFWKYVLSTMFIIDLTYIVPLEKIDSRMKDHMVFLRKCYAENLFVASGRKVPRTGGIILATGKSKAEFQALMEQDPFVAEGLAEFRIIEFQTSQFHPDLKSLLNTGAKKN